MRVLPLSVHSLAGETPKYHPEGNSSLSSPQCPGCTLLPVQSALGLGWVVVAGWDLFGDLAWVLSCLPHRPVNHWMWKHFVHWSAVQTGETRISIQWCWVQRPEKWWDWGLRSAHRGERREQTDNWFRRPKVRHTWSLIMLRPTVVRSPKQLGSWILLQLEHTFLLDSQRWRKQ